MEVKTKTNHTKRIEKYLLKVQYKFLHTVTVPIKEMSINLVSIPKTMEKSFTSFCIGTASSNDYISVVLPYKYLLF